MPSTTEPDVAPIVTQGQLDRLADALKISRKTAAGQLARTHLQWWVPTAIVFAYTEKQRERAQRPTTSRDVKRIKSLIGTMRAIEDKLTEREEWDSVLRVLQLQERLKLRLDAADRDGQLEERYRFIENELRVILDCAAKIRSSLEDVEHNLRVIASVAPKSGNHSKAWLHQLAGWCLDHHAKFLAVPTLKPRVTEEAFVREMIALARTVLNDSPDKDGSADYLKAVRKARGAK